MKKNCYCAFLLKWSAYTVLLLSYFREAFHSLIISFTLTHTHTYYYTTSPPPPSHGRSIYPNFSLISVGRLIEKLNKYLYT